MAARNSSNEIKLTRIFDAPLKTVWAAWTDLEHVAKWWGPRGFTLTTHSKDLRSGGTWKYTMHGPDGTDWPNLTRYLEVEEFKRLVYDHGATEDRPALFRVTVLFSEAGGQDGKKTKMDMTMALATPEAAEETRKFIKKAGGDSTWDRLAEYLAKRTSGKERFVLARSFDVPARRMFEMWTNPEHVAKWMPPTGAEMRFLEADIRAGGSSSYVMTAPFGTMYGRADYQTIEKHRLVYTQQFIDENGAMSRHPLAPTWPAVMLTVVTLDAEGPDRTRVTITWEPHGETTAEELATFIQGRSGMTQGWTGSLDKLEALIG